MVVEYKKHSLADDSDDEKRIFKAGSRARASVNALKKKKKVPASAESCLVPRPQYYASVIRFGSRGPGRKVWPRQKSRK